MPILPCPLSRSTTSVGIRRPSQMSAHTQRWATTARERCSAALALTAIVMLGGCGGSSTSSPSSTNSLPIDGSSGVTGHSSRPTSMTREGDLVPYIGEWQGHSSVVRIDASGNGTIHWRIGTLCDKEHPPPCDESNGSDLLTGGRAVVAIRAVTDRSAMGDLTTSTAEFLVPTGSVEIWVDPRNDLLYLSPSPNGTAPFCGPEAPSALCGA